MEPVHVCHAIGCSERVPPHLLMCARHWYKVPVVLRRLVWRYYRPGQEIDKQPTLKYIAAAREAINAVAEQEGQKLLTVNDPIAKSLTTEN